MRVKKLMAILTAALLLLITLSGCGSDKPLWQLLEAAQYNRYKPLLDHMVEKYGDMFEMDVYGSVTCTDPEYKDWYLRNDSVADNFTLRLRRDEVERFIGEIAEPVFGECKVYVTDGMSSTLELDADIEDFFTYEKWGLVMCCICVPYSEDYREKAEKFSAAMEDRGYDLCTLDLRYLYEEQYQQANRDSIKTSTAPKGYKFRLLAQYNYDQIEWFENFSLDHMVEKYGDRFQMDIKGNITCTEPEYQDWVIELEMETKPEVWDNFSIRLRREDLEGYMREFAEPVFGECKAFVVGGGASTLDVDADTEEYFHFQYEPAHNVMLVDFCICAPYSEDYREKADAFASKLYTSRYNVRRIFILYFDEAQYAQADRTPRIKGNLLKPEITGADGYKLGLYRIFSDLEYPSYNFNDKKQIHWTEVEG